MFSKREAEGYLEIDHRDSPGISDELAAKVGRGTIPVRGGQFFQSPTITCSHCKAMRVLNPDRSRARGYCPKCDAYLCDRCETNRVLTGECYPFKRMADEFLDAAAKGRDVRPIIAAFEARLTRK